MKKTYTSPELEVIQFEAEDIMSASGVTYNGELAVWASAWSSLSDW